MKPTQAERANLTNKLKRKLSKSQRARTEREVLASIERVRMSKSNLEAAFETYLKTIGADLPAYKREYRFHAVRRWRFDWAWPAKKLAVEIDGGQWVRGGGRHNSDKDREKMNAAAVGGWRVVRFSGGMLKRDPVGCVETVRQALEK